MDRVQLHPKLIIICIKFCYNNVHDLHITRTPKTYIIKVLRMMNEYDLQSTPAKAESVDDLEDGLISLKLSSKKHNTDNEVRSRTNSRTDALGRKQSLSPKKSMRFSITSNNKDFLNNSLVEETSNSSTPLKKENTKDTPNVSMDNNSNKLNFTTGNDMENLLLELAKRQRYVSELQIKLAEAEKSLKEWEMHCQQLMSGPNNTNTNGNKVITNANEHGASEVFSRWTSKIKATTDEILSLGHHESTPNKKEKPSTNITENSKSAGSNFFQNSFGKFTDIIQEFYDDEHDEKVKKEESKEQEMTDMSHKKDEGNLFDKLKNKFSEFSVINEDEEDEFDQARSGLLKPDSMHYELIDHSGISLDGIHTYTGSLSDSE